MLLKELFLKEDDRATAVFAFGRFNPPTIGHQKLLNKVQEMAKQVNGKGYVFLSQKQNNKTDPLTFKEKQDYIQMFYPGIVIGDLGVKTIIQALQKIQAEGRTRVVMVAGSDRVSEFESLLNKYNGKEYDFDSITITSAGERDPDDEGVAGMSASKMRQAASDDDFDSFKKGLPRPLQRNAKKVYDTIRKNL